MKGSGFGFGSSALSMSLIRHGVIRDGDALLWLDSGLIIPDSNERRPGWAAGVLHSFRDVLRFKDLVCSTTMLPEYEYTKGDIFKRFGTAWDSQWYGRTNQFLGGLWGVNVSRRTRAFLSQLEELHADFHLISDEASVTPDSPFYKSNHHDQSLFSMLVKAALSHNSSFGLADLGRRVHVGAWDATLGRGSDQIAAGNQSPDLATLGMDDSALGLDSIPVPAGYQTTGVPTPSMRQAKVHLVSHRHAPRDQPRLNRTFTEQLQRLENESVKWAWLDTRHLYHSLPDEITSDARWKRHLSHDRGYGFWFWKSALVAFLIREGVIRDGDVFLWLDADLIVPGSNMRLAGSAASILQKFREILRYKDLVCPITALPEYVHTKGDIFKRFGTTWDSQWYGRTNQFLGSLWGVNVSRRTRAFLSQLQELHADFHLISDEASVTPDSPLYKGNRHDQSLLSMLIKAALSHNSSFGLADLGSGFKLA
ncbi:unnamed protein product [Prorocentrum cordatum]|uniref:Uncharacterized protein n=1 Tax=Prorocentrum cordatum TaxID=2364126 RepID=A0ABN9X6S9_9DINO|nr:unnamed protein product [Polarella glacialis]